MGTTFVYPEEKEPKQGRVLVLQWEGGGWGVHWTYRTCAHRLTHTSTHIRTHIQRHTHTHKHTHTQPLSPPSPGKLSQVTYTIVEGPVYSLAVVSSENRLVAAAFSTVFAYNWQAEDQQLERDCFYEGCILALYMKAKGDFVLVRPSSGVQHAWCDAR